MTKSLPISPTSDLHIEWAEIPSHALYAELARRQDGIPNPSCGTSSNRAAYNTPLHVAALFIILILSTLACSFPIIVRRFPSFPVPHRFLFLSRHFGTGVLIATAFVHLLPTAFVSMTDPCLPWFWNKGYPAMPGLIAMISVFIVVGIEMFFAMHGAGHVHGGEYDSVKNKDPGNGNASYQNKNYNGNKRLSHHRQESYNRYRQEVQIDNGEEAEFGINGQTPEIAMRNFAPGSSNSRPAEEEEAFDRGDFTPPSSSRLSPRPPDEEQYPISPFLEEEGASTHLLPRSKSPHPSRPTSPNNPDLDHNHDHPQTPPMNPQKALLQCLLLEAGILFHSIFIGMALSVSVGPPFLVLLLAISFHQTFEGLALGSRISALIASPRPKKSTSNSTSPSSNINPTTAPIFESTSLKPWLMALAYGTTTPIGQAIGLAVHRLYDPNSEVGLLTVGIMNAVSSGLLLFAGLVELLAEDFLSDRSYETLRGRRRIEACAAVVAGGGLMALVGAWA